MDVNEKQQIIRTVATAGILGTITAAIRALLTKNESPVERLRNFLAGVFMAVFLGFVLRDAAISNFWKEIIVGCASAFISTVWPIIEKLVVKSVKKKGNDILRSDMD